MSKGGAGKVYFVLYLAVILELLIIFIERDEAEENLRREQQQALLIVQTILSQLQTGQGVSGITTTLKDNIVLDEREPEKLNRTYAVFVAVGDPKAVSNTGGKLVRGDDVAKLDYVVSHIADPNRLENELGPDSADIDSDKGTDTRIYQAQLGTDVGSLTTPREIFSTGGVPVADGKMDSVFIYNEELTKIQTDKGRRVKVFTVNFKPNKGEGWYRLRFYSETNKILGVTGDPKDSDTIRIGNIKLTVKQLRQVQKALRKQKKDDAGARVQQYINQLLKPDEYRKLPENQGFTSFNVRVERPDLPPPAEPFATIASPRDTIYWLEGAPFQVQVTLGPKEGQYAVSGASITKLDDARNLYQATIDSPQEGTLELTARSSNGGKTALDNKYLVVSKPMLRARRLDKDGNPLSSGIDAWRGLTAVYGVPYDPSSEWNNPQIPADHYQTKVTIKGVEVLNKPGVTFKNLSSDLQKAMTINEGTKPDDIVTQVYWKPGGTADETKWKLLLSNQENSGALFPLEKRRMKVGYRAPELITEQADFVIQFNPKNKVWTSPPFQAIQRIGSQEYPVTVNATCAECDKFPLIFAVEQVDDRSYRLKLDAVDIPRLIKSGVSGKRFEVDLSLSGRGDVKTEGMSMTVTVAPR